MIPAVKLTTSGESAAQGEHTMTNSGGNVAEAPNAEAASPGADVFHGAEDHANSEEAVDGIGLEDVAGSACKLTSVLNEVG